MTGKKANSNAITLTVWLIRLTLGALFITSGLAKAIDLYGTVFKFEDYFAVWACTIPRSLTMMAALTLSSAEFILGYCLLLGNFRRLTVWLASALMLAMTTLTVYIYIYDPVSDCGCFGDLWHLGNGTTLLKNILITAAIIPLWMWNTHVPPLFTIYTQWITIPPAVAYIIIIALYGYNIQPMLDFRSFAIGTQLLETADGPEPTYLYTKNGQTREFSPHNLPDDSWQYLDRIDHTDPDARRTEFTLTDPDGNDITEEAISGSGQEILVVITDPQRADVSWTYYLNELADTILAHGGSMIALVAGTETHAHNWRDIALPAYDVYPASQTMLRELVRGNIALVQLQDGTVTHKQSLYWTQPDRLIAHYTAQTLTNRGPAYFKWLTITLLAILTALYLLDSTGRLVNWLLKRRKNSKKNVTLQHQSQNDCPKP